MKQDKRGIFGLTAVQQFFIIILAIALLAYVIVIIMGTLNTTTILPLGSYKVDNETGGFINTTGYTLSKATLPGFASPTLGVLINTTSSAMITSGNYTLTGNIVYNTSTVNWNTVTIAYTYKANTVDANNLNGVITNTSSGVTSFFSSINPVYAILAVLVIILVLVVLVRVVGGGSMGGMRGGGDVTPSQL